VYNLPLADASADLAVSIFSPFAEEEFARVLKPGGKLLSVIPLERHLFGLKALLYDRPYLNQVKPYALPGWSLCSAGEIRLTLHMDRPEEIRALFMMTPYYYRTRPADRARIESLTSLDTEAEFALLVYEKLPNFTEKEQ